MQRIWNSVEDIYIFLYDSPLLSVALVITEHLFSLIPSCVLHPNLFVSATARCRLQRIMTSVHYSVPPGMSPSPRCQDQRRITTGVTLFKTQRDSENLLNPYK